MSHWRTAALFSVTGAVWLWLGALVLAPLHARDAAPASRLAAGATYVLGSRLCHQRPERSLAIGGRAMPVCARCAGLYAGAGLGLLGATAWLGRGRALRAADVPVSWARAALIGAAVPTAVAWAAEFGGMARVSAPLRASLAVPLGVAVAVVVAVAIAGRFDEGPPGAHAH